MPYLTAIGLCRAGTANNQTQGDKEFRQLDFHGSMLLHYVETPGRVRRHEQQLITLPG
jgi:hypothetical protein